MDRWTVDFNRAKNHLSDLNNKIEQVSRVLQ